MSFEVPSPVPTGAGVKNKNSKNDLDWKALTRKKDELIKSAKAKEEARKRAEHAEASQSKDVTEALRDLAGIESEPPKLTEKDMLIKKLKNRAHEAGLDVKEIEIKNDGTRVYKFVDGRVEEQSPSKDVEDALEELMSEAA